ncbi:MAG: hypothetical protein IKN29_00505, partial [Bacteroidales bacterium]|nr:hypothetical protein [Bacteroidales bacterium]
MKKTLMLCAMMAAMFANSPLHAQSEAKGSVMTVRVCDFDTLKADDTTILGYVFLEQYYLDERETSVAMKVYRPTLDDIRNAEKLLRNKYT